MATVNVFLRFDQVIYFFNWEKNSRLFFAEFEIKIRTITIFPQNSIISQNSNFFPSEFWFIIRFIVHWEFYFFFLRITYIFSRILTFPQNSKYISQNSEIWLFLLRIMKLKSEFLLFFREFPPKNLRILTLFPKLHSLGPFWSDRKKISNVALILFRTGSACWFELVLNICQICFKLYVFNKRKASLFWKYGRSVETLKKKVETSHRATVGQVGDIV